MENHSKLSQLSGPDTVPCQHSQDGAPDSEPASDLALWSGQSCTSNQEYSGSSPMTWSKDGDAEAAPVNATWSDLFDNQEKLKIISMLLLAEGVVIGVHKYLKVPDVPLPPTKPTSLGCSTSLEFIPNSIWANCQAVDDLVRMGTPVFGVMEYLHCDHHDTVPDHCPDSPKAATAAVAKYFAAMKKWDEQNVDVAKYIIHIEVPLVHVQHLVNWFIRPHLGYPGELDHNNHPLCEAALTSLVVAYGLLPRHTRCQSSITNMNVSSVVSELRSWEEPEGGGGSGSNELAQSVGLWPFRIAQQLETGAAPNSSGEAFHQVKGEEKRGKRKGKGRHRLLLSPRFSQMCWTEHGDEEVDPVRRVTALLLTWVEIIDQYKEVATFGAVWVVSFVHANGDCDMMFASIDPMGAGWDDGDSSTPIVILVWGWIRRLGPDPRLWSFVTPDSLDLHIRGPSTGSRTGSVSISSPRVITGCSERDQLVFTDGPICINSVSSPSGWPKIHGPPHVNQSTLWTKDGRLQTLLWVLNIVEETEGRRWGTFLVC
ncbi:hypothetical protein BS47DRAFT_1368484 [Hydnum rufescens UP504]|uniref:Uncharacterized protein n=1 Tax=Hydnum rufescens UP504 TaxID=1448309 RepID=A0A9P6DN34_9AGAM|nr:hypothetical protein BS47DRAFT_1368484 [Hydnum rufescens UP504]